MKIYTVFDDSFLDFAHIYYESLRYYNKTIELCAAIPSDATKSLEFCKQKKINLIDSENNLTEHINDLGKTVSLTAKSISRLLKMSCIQYDSLRGHNDTVMYTDIDIIFQNDPAEIVNFNPNFLWTLSKREGKQTTLRTWKKHYFRKSNYEYAKKAIKKLFVNNITDNEIEQLLESPVRNCGVIYGHRDLVSDLFLQAKKKYIELLKINQEEKTFSDSDQLCFLIAFDIFKNVIRELPIKFNRMPYHQSYDFKDKSSLFIPDNVILHFNRKKEIADEIIKNQEINKPFNINVSIEDRTRVGVVVPLQTSKVAERALIKNLYYLEVANKANIYRDEDVGYILSQKIDEIEKIRQTLTDKPAIDRGLFFLVNSQMFMIDHGEYTGKRASWRLGQYINKDLLSGIFVEQMEPETDYSVSQIPIIPLTYGIKDPLMWINQSYYHNISLNKEKKYSVYFAGNFGTNKQRKVHADLLSNIKNSKIIHTGMTKKLNFDTYMQELASSNIAWCPPGGRPKTHREVEAMCCEVCVLMPEQKIIESEQLVENVHYFQIKNDHSDVLEKIEYLLGHEEERKKIAYNGRLWYERNASEHARAKYILENCLSCLNVTNR